MKYYPRPEIQLPALQGEPIFPVEVWTKGTHHEYQIPDGSGMLYGSIVPNGPAEITWIGADGGGRGTYLARAFMEDAVLLGAVRSRAFAVHPGTIAIYGKIFGPTELKFYLTNHGRDTPCSIPYAAALQQLEKRQADYAARGKSKRRAITVMAGLGSLVAQSASSSERNTED